MVRHEDEQGSLSPRGILYPADEVGHTTVGVAEGVGPGIVGETGI